MLNIKIQVAKASPWPPFLRPRKQSRRSALDCRVPAIACTFLSSLPQRHHRFVDTLDESVAFTTFHADRCCNGQVSAPVPVAVGTEPDELDAFDRFFGAEWNDSAKRQRK